MPLSNPTPQFPVTLSAGSYAVIRTEGAEVLTSAAEMTIYDAILMDTFNRADSAVTLGNADTGQTWTAAVGTFGISSNQAYAAALTADFAKAVIDAGAANCIVTASIPVIYQDASAGVRIMFRHVDVQNEWTIGANSTGYKLYKRIANTLTQVGSTSATLPVNGDTVKITLNGNDITVEVNGVALFNVTDAVLNTATKQGFTIYASTTSRIENFIVEAL